MPLEDLRGDGIARAPVAPVDAEKIRGAGCCAFGLHLLERRMGAADVVEDAVEQDADAALTAGGNEVVEVLLVARAGVDAEVVDSVVPMRGRGEHRTQRDSVEPEL